MWQGEERNSSDEEWEAAYAALDPIARIGWVNRCAPTTAVGAQLVRDVFQAADAMHDNAMSEMDGNTTMEEETGGHGTGAADGGSSTPLGTEASVEHLQSMEVELEGESHTVWDALYVVEVVHACCMPMLPSMNELVVDLVTERPTSGVTYFRIEGLHDGDNTGNINHNQLWAIYLGICGHIVHVANFNMFALDSCEAPQDVCRDYSAYILPKFLLADMSRQSVICNLVSLGPQTVVVDQFPTFADTVQCNES